MVSSADLPVANPHSTEATAKVLRERIRDGKYVVGDWLPAERDLTEELKVNRRVVRAAIGELEKEGILLCRRYCRPIVQAIPGGERRNSETEVSASRLIALVMYHGGELEEDSSSQQRIFWGLNQELASAGYHGVFLDLGKQIGTDQENAEREAAHLRYVIECGFGGVVFYPYAYGNNAALVRDVVQRVPLVLLDRTMQGVDSDFVGAQNFRAMFDSTKYLLGLGHRRIAYITKPEPIIPVQDRLQGYLEAINDGEYSGLHEMVLTIPFVGDDWPVFDAVFNMPKEKRPTAAICVNDYDAVRAARRLKHLHLNIPDDVSVIGCDDIVKELPGGPGLTTIAQPFEEIGREAARLLMRRMKDFHCPTVHSELPVRLTVRQSTISI